MLDGNGQRLSAVDLVAAYQLYSVAQKVSYTAELSVNRIKTCQLGHIFSIKFESKRPITQKNIVTWY